MSRKMAGERSRWKKNKRQGDSWGRCNFSSLLVNTVVVVFVLVVVVVVVVIVFDVDVVLVFVLVIVIVNVVIFKNWRLISKTKIFLSLKNNALWVVVRTEGRTDYPTT